MKTRQVMRLALAVLALATAGCGKPAAKHAGADELAAAPLSDGGPASGASLFEMEFPLTDQNGDERRLADFRGRPFVASMVYTQCKSVCPRIAADLKALDAALPAADREGMRFVLFSLDPQRDTPEAMRGFLRAHELDSTRWTLLATSEEDMRTLAAVLDVRFRPDGEGEIAHTAVVAVVDSGGVVRHRQAGVAGDRAPLVAAVHGVTAR